MKWFPGAGRWMSTGGYLPFQKRICRGACWVYEFQKGGGQMLRVTRKT